MQPRRPVRRAVLGSGAFVRSVLQLAASGRFRTIVTVLSGGGERYTSTWMWRRPV